MQGAQSGGRPVHRVGRRIKGLVRGWPSSQGGRPGRRGRCLPSLVPTWRNLLRGVRSPRRSRAPLLGTLGACVAAADQGSKTVTKKEAKRKARPRPKICRKSKRGANGRYWSDGGVISRDDGPAIEYDNGGKAWMRRGYYHREDGPVAETETGVRMRKHGGGLRAEGR